MANQDLELGCRFTVSQGIEPLDRPFSQAPLLDRLARSRGCYFFPRRTAGSLKLSTPGPSPCSGFKYNPKPRRQRHRYVSARMDCQVNQNKVSAGNTAGLHRQCRRRTSTPPALLPWHRGLPIVRQLPGNYAVPRSRYIGSESKITQCIVESALHYWAQQGPPLKNGDASERGELYLGKCGCGIFGGDVCVARRGGVSE